MPIWLAPYKFSWTNSYINGTTFDEVAKVRRGNCIFISWIGDHGHHVHVYRDRRQILKWDLDENKAMKGKATRRVIRLIEKLKKEGIL